MECRRYYRSASRTNFASLRISHSCALWHRINLRCFFRETNNNKKKSKQYYKEIMVLIYKFHSQISPNGRRVVGGGARLGNWALMKAPERTHNWTRFKRILCQQQNNHFMVSLYSRWVIYGPTSPRLMTFYGSLEGDSTIPAQHRRKAFVGTSLRLMCRSEWCG